MNESATSNITVGAETLRDLYVTMRRIRAFEDKTADLFEEGVVKGTAHSYKGEEAIAAGVCEALRDDDIIASYHRGHGHCIAKGARIDRMMAELMGRQTGYCQGLGGSMHIADMELNIMGANGIVGAAMPLATGAGLAAKLQGTDRVAVAFFGDGASNQGVFHESLNLAAVWKLPVIFVCENNQYALSTSYRNTTAVSQVSNRAASYEIPGITVDGNDGVEVYLVLREAVDRARAGEGPTLIEAMTYRHGQHSLRVNLRDPRPEDELESWLDRDPIARMEKRLTTEGDFSEEQFDETTQAVEEELETAVSYGRESPEPPVHVMLDAVYAPHAAHTEPGPDTERMLSYPEALNEALDQEMLRDDRVFLMGEDVGATGGIFGVSKGLMERYGADRVRDTPISEATFVGCGVGAAIAGMRPVVEIQIFDFVALTMDMLVNQAAKFRFMLGGKPSRAAGGARAPRRRHPARGPAQPEPGGVVHPRAGAGGGGAVEPLRREGPAGRRDPRREPRGLPGAEAALPRRHRPGAGGALRHPPRQGRHQARGHGRDRGGDVRHGAARAERRHGAGAGRHQRRGHRPPHPAAAGRGDHPRQRAQDQPAPHRARGLGARRLRRRGRGHGGGQGLRLSRRPRRPPRRPPHADALQRPPRARGPIHFPLRRALTPFACLRATRAAQSRRPDCWFKPFPSGAGRSLRSLGLRAFGAARSRALRACGPVPFGAGSSSASAAMAPLHRHARASLSTDSHIVMRGLDPRISIRRARPPTRSSTNTGTGPRRRCVAKRAERAPGA